MLLAMALALGFIIGYIVSLFIGREEIAETVHIVDEGGTPYLFLELNDEVELLYDKKYVKFKIHDKSFISQK